LSALAYASVTRYSSSGTWLSIVAKQGHSTRDVTCPMKYFICYAVYCWSGVCGQAKEWRSRGTNRTQFTEWLNLMDQLRLVPTAQVCPGIPLVEELLWIQVREEKRAVNY